MKSDQERMLKESLERLKKKLSSPSSNREEKEKIQEELQHVEEKLKRTVSTDTISL